MNSNQPKHFNAAAQHLLLNGADEAINLADSSFWIPFTATSSKTEFEVEKLEMDCVNFTVIEFNAVPSIATVKLVFLKILFKESPVDSLNLLGNLWSTCTLNERNNNLVRTVELIYLLKTVLQDKPDRENLSNSIFGMGYVQAISKIHLLGDLLVHKISSSPINHLEIPKWKGKAMQFIELISIGIELDLLEGANQNEICNSLLKAFQVDAESDQPIYKQRFNALFKRSKVHLPLIADFIGKVEDAKKIKISLSAMR